MLSLADLVFETLSLVHELIVFLVQAFVLLHEQVDITEQLTLLVLLLFDLLLEAVDGLLLATFHHLINLIVAQLMTTDAHNTVDDVLDADSDGVDDSHVLLLVSGRLLRIVMIHLVVVHEGLFHLGAAHLILVICIVLIFTVGRLALLLLDHGPVLVLVGQQSNHGDVLRLVGSHDRDLHGQVQLALTSLLIVHAEAFCDEAAANIL